jgi:hypothetical protein
MPNLDELNKQAEEELVVEFDDSKGLSWDHNIANCPYTRSRYIEDLIKILDFYIRTSSDHHLITIARHALEKLDYPIKQVKYTEEVEGESINKVVKHYGMVSFNRLSHSLNKRPAGRPKEDERRIRRIKTYLAVSCAIYCKQNNCKSESPKYRSKLINQITEYGIQSPDEFITRYRVAALRNTYMEKSISDLKAIQLANLVMLDTFFNMSKTKTNEINDTLLIE